VRDDPSPSRRNFGADSRVCGFAAGDFSRAGWAAVAGRAGPADSGNVTAAAGRRYGHQRLRDIAALADGTLVLWTDSAQLIFLSVDRARLEANQRAQL